MIKNRSRISAITVALAISATLSSSLASARFSCRDLFGQSPILAHSLEAEMQPLLRLSEAPRIKSRWRQSKTLTDFYNLSVQNIDAEIRKKEEWPDWQTLFINDLKTADFFINSRFEFDPKEGRLEIALVEVATAKKDGSRLEMGKRPDFSNRDLVLFMSALMAVVESTAAKNPEIKMIRLSTFRVVNKALQGTLDRLGFYVVYKDKPTFFQSIQMKLGRDVTIGRDYELDIDLKR